MFTVAYPPDSDIEISVMETYDKGRFQVRAIYKNDPYKCKTADYAYAEQGLLYFLGIGDSFETSLKKATCKAIKGLKEEWRKRETSRNNEKVAEEACVKFVKECGEKR